MTSMPVHRKGDILVQLEKQQISGEVERHRAVPGHENSTVLGHLAHGRGAPVGCGSLSAGLLPFACMWETWC